LGRSCAMLPLPRSHGSKRPRCRDTGDPRMGEKAQGWRRARRDLLHRRDPPQRRPFALGESGDDGRLEVPGGLGETRPGGRDVRGPVHQALFPHHEASPPCDEAKLAAANYHLADAPGTSRQLPWPRFATQWCRSPAPSRTGDGESAEEVANGPGGHGAYASHDVGLVGYGASAVAPTNVHRAASRPTRGRPSASPRPWPTPGSTTVAAAFASESGRGAKEKERAWRRPQAAAAGVFIIPHLHPTPQPIVFHASSHGSDYHA
jgi:hypothetical protein